jgi:hypothetical protein
MDRRAFLKGAGTVTAVSAGGGLWYANDRGIFGVGEGRAYEPWKDWQAAGGEDALKLVRAALLAASPHNTQPWRFKTGHSFIELQIDPQRNVGALDPYLREEHIGMGCALENLLLAAPANGYAASVDLIPGELSSITEGPQMERVARVELTPGVREESELYRAIPRRHTNRSLYNPQKPLMRDFLEQLSCLPSKGESVRLFLFTGEAERKKIVRLSAVANRQLYSDPGVAAASDRWIRLKWSDVQKFRDGLTIDAFGLPPMTAALAKALPTGMLSRIVTQSQKEGYDKRMLTAPLIGFIAVRNRYDRAQCLQAGRIWQRAHLLATARAVAARAANEAMELVDFERSLRRPARCLAQLGEITGDPTWQPTFAFLMGYPVLTAHASPRRPIQAVL